MIQKVSFMKDNLFLKEMWNIIVFTLSVLLLQVVCEDFTDGTTSAEDVKDVSGATTLEDNTEFPVINLLSNDSLLDFEINSSDLLNSTALDLENKTGTEIFSAPTTTFEVTDSTTLLTATTETTTTTTSSTSTTTTTTLPTTTTTATTPTTTTTTTTTTTMPTTTTSTTTRPTTTTPEMTTRKMTTSVPEAPTAGPTFMSESEDNYCTFLDANLLCKEEIVCYGEGEIDCSQEAEDPDPHDSGALDKISLSSFSEDYSDEEIETYPPDLVGVIRSNQKHQLLFKIRSLEESLSTSESDESDITDTLITTEAVTEMQTTEAVTELKVTDAFSKLKTTEAITEPRIQTSAPDSTINVPIIKEATTPELIPTFAATEVASTVEYQRQIAKATTTIIPLMTVDDTINQNLTETAAEDSVSAAIFDDGREKHVNIRKKRQENIFSSDSESAPSSMSASFHVQALESSKSKIRIKACKTTGNLRCSPTPTPSMCKGKTYCLIVSNNLETSEKSTRTKGVENWAIAVIAICAIAAALTISLLVYLVVTSWKKLKVQPQSGVTTLTYVNNTPA